MRSLNIENIKSLVVRKSYSFYRNKIFLKISNLRGATRLLMILSDLAINDLEEFEKEPESIFKEDWQNLIILDACRHDAFEEYIGKEVDNRTSLGCRTRQYISRTFGEDDFSDVIYITATPQLYEGIFEDLTGRKPSEVFHAVFNTYENSWDEDEGTVMPKDVIDDWKTANKLFPDKKKIIHFNQPHGPYITEDVSQPKTFREPDGEVKKLGDSERVSEKLDREEVKVAYQNNLDYVMSVIEEEMSFDGKTIITSDHGELLGENGIYGHPPGELRAKELRNVPWHVFQEQ